jgi:proline racemase
VAGYDAVDVVVAGRAWTVARSQLILDRDDPFPEGLSL